MYQTFGLKYWHFPSDYKDFIIYNYSIKTCPAYKEGEMSFKSYFKIGGVFG